MEHLSSFLSDFFSEGWSREDVFLALGISLILTLLFGRLYPPGTKPERINLSLAMAFRSFCFLVYGIMAFGMFGVRDDFLSTLSYVLVGVGVVDILKAIYRRFLSQEDMDWWMEKVLQERAGRDSES